MNHSYNDIIVIEENFFWLEMKTVIMSFNASLTAREELFLCEYFCPISTTKYLLIFSTVPIMIVFHNWSIFLYLSVKSNKNKIMQTVLARGKC